MTNHERAEKIVNFLSTKLSFTQQDWLINEITSQLDEAVRRAGEYWYDKGLRFGRKEGFGAARGKVIDIINVNSALRKGWTEIIERIRAMEAGK